MSKSVFYTMMTILYALWMFLTFVVAVHRDNTDPPETDDNLVPYAHTDRASRTTLLVWAMYTVQIVILMIYDMVSRG